MTPCSKCNRCPLCPLPIVRGDVLVAPSGEHCFITVEAGIVRKYLKPQANLANWQQRAAIAKAHPDLFVPFELVGRVGQPIVVVQPFVAGEGTPEDYLRICQAIRERGIRGVYDISPANIRGGRAVDFGLIDEDALQRFRAKKPANRRLRSQPTRPEA